MNLAQSFSEAAGRNPDKTAVYWGQETIRYRQLLAESRRAGEFLERECGLGPGDRVGLWMRNRPEFITALFGVFFAGGVAVPVNNFLKPSEAAYILNDAETRVLITEEAAFGAESSLAGQVDPALRVVTVEAMFSGTAAEVPEAPLVATTEGDLAFLIYTSGTTGQPKGAMLTHGNLLCNVASCREVLEAVALDGFVVLLPMFHSFMICVGILLPLTTGSSIVLIRSLHPLRSLLEEIMRGQGTILPAIPQFFRTMVSGGVPKELPLRLCVSGAAPLPVETLRRFKAKFPFPLVEGYGLSEASPVVALNPVAGPAKEGSIGLPIPGVEVTIQDERGALLPPGAVGELCVRGGNVMSGYWKRPEDSAQALRNGWLLTGDLGYKDADGYIHITDRKKDMLLVNGINVYPREIEEVIYQFPGVKEAAVIGMPDAKRGEQPVAFVVPEQDGAIEPKALLEFLRDRLADYKLPKRIDVLPALPRNATGKVLKTELRAMTREQGR